MSCASTIRHAERNRSRRTLTNTPTSHVRNADSPRKRRHFARRAHPGLLDEIFGFVLVTPGEAQRQRVERWRMRPVQRSKRILAAGHWVAVTGPRDGSRQG